jgi:predicted phosphodiesterase
MTFDYISDLHINFLFSAETTLSERAIAHNFNKVFATKSSDYLLVAGDISEYPDRAFEFLKMIIKVYKYKKIFWVFGNHDLWLPSKKLQQTFNLDSMNKINYVKNWLMGNDKEQDVILLDGDVVEVEGVKLGGTMGWYDTVYDTECIQPFISPESGLTKKLHEFWSMCMNDYRYILPTRHNYTWLTKLEHDKVRRVLEQSPDVVMTHICPVIGDEYVKSTHAGDRVNTFYQMDFRKEILSTKPKFWVYGHQHNTAEYTYGDTQLLLNPHGYPLEALGCKVKSFTV